MAAMRNAMVPIALILAGCGTLDHKTIKIEPGASKAAVLQIMGTPVDRQFQQKSEAWQYCQTGAGFGFHDYKIVWFADGSVTGITSYKANNPGSCVGGLQPIRWETAPDQTIEVRHR